MLWSIFSSYEHILLIFVGIIDMFVLFNGMSHAVFTEKSKCCAFLQLAYNSLTVEGALVLISVIKNSLKTALEEINICVSLMCDM